MAKTKQTLFVIIAGVQQHVAFGTCSIAQEASLTMMRSKAARFDSGADAKECSEGNHIAFNARTYIGREDFIDLEIRGRSGSIIKDRTTGVGNDDHSSC